MNRGISTAGRPNLVGTTCIDRLLMYARRHDVDLSIARYPRFETIAGLMDMPGTVYTSQEPWLEWHTEEIGRLGDMAGMEELRGLASKIGMAGRRPFRARPAPMAEKTTPFGVAEPRIATLHVAFRLDRKTGRVTIVNKLGGFGNEACLYLTNGAMFPEIRRFVRARFADVENTIFR